jgi:hypothetical protein
MVTAAGAATAEAGEAATGEAVGEETIPVAAAATTAAAGAAETTGAGEADLAMTMEAVEADVEAMTIAAVAEGEEAVGPMMHPETAAGAAPRRSRRGMRSCKGGRCL